MGSLSQLTKFGHAMNQYFLFDPKFKNLNHGMSTGGSFCQLRRMSSTIKLLTFLVKAPSEHILPLFRLFSTSTKALPKQHPTGSCAILARCYSTPPVPPSQSN